MSDEYPLYPGLSEDGAKLAQSIIDEFKKELVKVATGAIDELYVDVAAYIESDSWTNYRNHLMNGLSNYNNREKQGDYDFKKIRQAIYEEFREDIINDLNQDLVKEVEDLKKHIGFLQDRRY